MDEPVSWARRLVGQLEYHWEAHVLPRLDGLTDEEYFWEPVEGCWSLRPTGDGRWRMDGGDSAPGQPPLTTIAWRMTHISVECYESRWRAFFDGEGPNQWSPGERLLAAGDLPGTALAPWVVALSPAMASPDLGGADSLSSLELATPTCVGLDATLVGTSGVM